MIKGIVSAASFLYDRNIIHRDIKPQNILISKGVPKMADFGFAK
jgi:serine/threonine-protein kinase ULK/ATG1